MARRPAVIMDEPELGRQAAKSKATQDKIINAVIALIREGGFAAASSTRIARKAGGVRARLDREARRALRERRVGALPR